MLKNIDYFERTYTSDRALYWYTRPDFFNILVNRALRTNDIKSIYIFRDHIVDIHKALRKAAKNYRLQLRRQGVQSLVVYRGTTMSKSNYEVLELYGINRYICLNGFVSTTTDEEVAKIYAASNDGSTISSDNVVSVIYVVTIETDNEEVVFINVSDSSAIIDEREILFDIGTTFKVNKIIPQETYKTFYVYMTATHDGIHIAHSLIRADPDALCETTKSRLREWFSFAWKDADLHLTMDGFEKQKKQDGRNGLIGRVLNMANLAAMSTDVARQSSHQLMPRSSNRNHWGLRLIRKVKRTVFETETTCDAFNHIVLSHDASDGYFHENTVALLFSILYDTESYR
ncbi:unnamed protein product [Rotaria sp. Silwood2]|nr:unnamed protein product [Rotaria sp. Silwood2]CAF4497614.1 unnamed protein product [Rotaria sp. Silwood2]